MQRCEVRPSHFPALAQTAHHSLLSIHDFIMSLPDGYNTDVGGKGAQVRFILRSSW